MGNSSADMNGLFEWGQPIFSDIPLDISTKSGNPAFMSATVVIKNSNFQMVSEFAKPDSKMRLSLSGALEGISAVNIYRNAIGQIFLDPVKVIPASEAWLFDNPQALASVKRGLKESAAGKRCDRGSFSRHARE